MTYNGGQRWKIEHTDEFEDWWVTLTEAQQEALTERLRRLGDSGPALGRPLVDTLAGSRYPNMKERASAGGTLRVLFAFDPRRVAVLLVGGDKSGDWRGWYQRAIPEADRLYAAHLLALDSCRDRDEGDRNGEGLSDLDG